MVLLQSLSSTVETWEVANGKGLQRSLAKQGRRQSRGMQNRGSSQGSQVGGVAWAQPRKKAHIDPDLIQPLNLQHSLSSASSMGSVTAGLKRPSSQQSMLGMSKTVSEKQMRLGARKLEPLQCKPVSFDEMYNAAKLRVKVKRHGQRSDSYASQRSTKATNSLSASPMSSPKAYRAALVWQEDIAERPPEEMLWATTVFDKLQKDVPCKVEVQATKRKSSRPLSRWYTNPELVDPKERIERFQYSAPRSDKQSLRRASAYIEDVRNSIVWSDVPSRRDTPLSSKSPTRKSTCLSVDSSHGSASATSTWTRKALQRKSTLYLAQINLPNAELHCSLRDALTAVQKENRNDLDGFTAQELERMRLAFTRFNTEGEVHIDDVGDLLSHLGFLRSSDEVLRGMVREVTPYSSLDFEELMRVTENYAVWEREFCKDKFKAFDEDNSGKLDVSELGNVLQSLGIYPLKATVGEALEVVETDSDGQLDFDEFVHLMAVYRVTEGFTRNEVRGLWRVFDRFAKAAGSRAERPEMKEDHLQDAMTLMFGMQINDHAGKIMEEVMGTEKHKKSQVREASGSVSNKPTNRGLLFPEFLVWARRLRELDIKDMRAQFMKFDNDGSGAIDTGELKDLFRSLGYIPLQPMIDEVLEKVDEDGNGELDFDEFMELLSIFRESDGFMEDEMEEFRHAFQHVADDVEGEVSRVDLLGIIRSLGYISSLEEVRKIYDKVDVNGSGLLDFREFVHLMRMHRNEELQEVEAMFNNEKNEKTNSMPIASLGACLRTLGYGVTEKHLYEILEEVVGTIDGRVALTTVDFDQFVQVADSSRKGVMDERKKKAGFSDDEIEGLRAAFDKYDEDGNEDIERNELVFMMKDLNMPIATAADQQSLIPKLDEARIAAEDCGVEPELLGMMGDPKIKFWPLVHFIRQITHQLDAHFERREAEVIPEVNFTPKEVLDFRELFTFFSQKMTVQPQLSSSSASSFTKDASSFTKAVANIPSMGAPQPAWLLPDKKTIAHPSPKPSPRQLKKRVTTSKFLGKPSEMADDRSPNWLPGDGVLRILTSFGATLKKQDKSALEQKLQKYDRDEHGRIDFADFLRLMRWMVDTDFSGLGATISASANA